MEQIRRLQANIPTMNDLQIEGIKLRARNPYMQLDLGGIAKGYGIDQAIETLQAMGIDNAIINAGGDLRAIGRHGGRPWAIGIQHPRKPIVLASITTIADESIFTSGDYQRFYLEGSKRRHHIIDPETGEPVSHTIAVTVIHSQATVADAAATALMAAGKERMTEVARSMGIEYLMLMASDGEIFVNSKMKQRLKFNNELQLNLHLISL